MKPFRADPSVVLRLRLTGLGNYPETITLLSMFLRYRDVITNTFEEAEHNYCVDDVTVIWRERLRNEMKNIAWHLKREDGIEPYDLSVLQQMHTRVQEYEAAGDWSAANAGVDRMIHTFIRAIADRTWEGSIPAAADFLVKELEHKFPRND